MKCCICGNEIDGYGNNPAPICAPDDTESRCCDICNGHVINARLFEYKYKKIGQIPTFGDKVIIFHSNVSKAPIDTINEYDKFLAGEVTNEENLPDNCVEGSWGNFLLNTKNDSYVIIDA